jgi:hypothetical protein
MTKYSRNALFKIMRLTFAKIVRSTVQIARSLLALQVDDSKSTTVIKGVVLAFRAIRQVSGTPRH